jgi:hypothetical protein
MARVRQIFDDERIRNIAEAVDREFAKADIGSAILPGASVAITVGSRGVANIAEIIRAIVRNVKVRGGSPFVFPAMGSHGGATAEGQRAMLEGFGVTESFVDAPIRATMETKVIGQTPKGQDVHIDRFAAEADGIIVVGRVKPHTDFRGEYESGLMKMMAIGMGKQKGAEICHTEGFGRMAENVPAFGKVVLERASVLFGLAILENSFETTFRIEAVPKASIEKREPELLAEAKRLMPSILIPRFDILIVDRIGKDFSGEGADPNITGTYCTPYASGGPEVQRYVVLDLSEETHGNSLGVGMADFTTKRLFDKTDFDASYPNSLTSRLVKTVKMPMVLENDRLAIKAAIYTCIDIDPKAPRIVRIANTSHIDVIGVSETLLPELSDNRRIEVLDLPKELPFGIDGNLPGLNG